MTAQDIAKALMNAQKPYQQVSGLKNGTTITRVDKAKRQAAANGIPWQKVLNCLNPAFWSDLE